jgi:hypothetical protein
MTAAVSGPRSLGLGEGDVAVVLDDQAVHAAAGVAPRVAEGGVDERVDRLARYSGEPGRAGRWTTPITTPLGRPNKAWRASGLLR